MPIEGLSREEKFSEVRHGKGFRRTEKKFGRAKARKQMIARVLESERREKRKGRKHRKGRTKRRESGR